MPKAQKSSQNAPDAKVKQITDFFPRKQVLSQGASPGASRPTVASQWNARQLSTKENTTPLTCNSHSRTKQGSESPTNTTASSDSQRAGAGSPIPTKTIHITSPMQPSTKRFRSQSIASPQPSKQSKRSKHILCESKFEEGKMDKFKEGKMDVEESAVVYVRSEPAPVPNSSFLQVPPSDTTRVKKFRFSTPPDHQLEVISLVPSSLSEEKELEQNRPEQKDVRAVKEAVDHWRQQTLPPSPSTSVNSPTEPSVESRPISQSSTPFDTDWSMAVDSVDNSTPSRPNFSATTASIPTPPSTDGPDDIHLISPIKPLDAKAKTEQIIRDIKARAYAQSRAQEPSSPLSEIASLDSTDDEDDNFDGLDGLGLGNSTKLKSPLKAKSPAKPTRYNLRKPSAKMGSDKPNSTSNLYRDIAPSPPARQKPAVNPLDALLKEKQVIDGKNGARSADREAQLRDLASMNLNDESDDDVDGLNKLKTNIPILKEDVGNPFIDDEQKQQVMEILKGDRMIEDEEEHLRQQGKVGVTLWDISESYFMDSCDVALLPLEYLGSDPTLRAFAQTTAHGNRELIHLMLQTGALELANYADGGINVVNWLIGLALSRRDDNLDFSASRVLSNVLSNSTIVMPVPLFEHMLFTLRALGAKLSILERLGWVVSNEPRSGISDDERSVVVERLMFCVIDAAKACRLNRRETPDIVAALLLIGMDSSSHYEMKLQVSQAIHEVCQSVGQENDVDVDVESAICNKVLHLIQPHTLQNKSYALNFLATGAGRTARIARSVAHAMLSNKSALLPSQYSPLPPLSEIMTMLGTSTQDSPRPAGKFEIHEGTDYVDMACWTCVLAVAITAIPQYLEQEESSKSMLSPSKSPAKEKDQSLVHALHEKLYKIHGRIQDTRAAHLDRSRTKAIIFQTAFRILYQYQAVTQNRRKNNQNIQNYFRRK